MRGKQNNAWGGISIQGGMGKLVQFSREPAGFEKRARQGDEYVRGQQILANAIFHWKNDPASDARAGVRFLLHHLATAFRADDGPLQPRAVREGEEEDRG